MGDRASDTELQMVEIERLGDVIKSAHFIALTALSVSASPVTTTTGVAGAKTDTLPMTA